MWAIQEEERENKSKGRDSRVARQWIRKQESKGKNMIEKEETYSFFSYVKSWLTTSRYGDMSSFDLPLVRHLISLKRERERETLYTSLHLIGQWTCPGDVISFPFLHISFFFSCASFEIAGFISLNAVIQFSHQFLNDRRYPGNVAFQKIWKREKNRLDPPSPVSGGA